MRWNRRLRLLCTICNFTLILAKILQNDAKFIQKLTPGFKNHEEFENFRQAVESKKLKFNGLLSKKYIPSAKTLHAED